MTIENLNKGKMTLKNAMIFAAGRGTRMRELTDDCPKPFLKINGVSIIERLITRLVNHGITNILVNIHYKADIAQKALEEIQAKFGSQLNLTISKEDNLLETGGGAKLALKNYPDFFKNGAFWAFNGDMLWHDDRGNDLLFEMMEAWDEDTMDLMLSLFPKEKVEGNGGRGDYHLLSNGQLKRTSDETAPYLFAGARICKTDLLPRIDENAFSFLKLFDLAQSEGKLFGHLQTGAWYHIGTPETLAHTDTLFKEIEVKKKANFK
ncbi:MAG: hypothetical protein CMP22_00855 [Rickettsiales bacterium]|nr:hypothetical protein [Rickettsiales bacterium]